MEVVWKNPDELVNFGVSVFSIGYVEEGDRVYVYYLRSCGPETLRLQFEVVVNRSKAGFSGKGFNLRPRAS